MCRQSSLPVQVTRWGRENCIWVIPISNSRRNRPLQLEPRFHGCFRMFNQHIVELYNKVKLERTSTSCRKLAIRQAAPQRSILNAILMFASKA